MIDPTQIAQYVQNYPELSVMLTFLAIASIAWIIGKRKKDNHFDETDLYK